MYEPKIDPEGSIAALFSETFEELGVLVGEVNVANGWDRSRDMESGRVEYPDAWKVTHKIAELGLIMTEASEAIDEVRGGHSMTETYYKLPSGAITDIGHNVDGTPRKPEGVPSELADVLIRALDLADAYGIDLGAAVVEKLNHNATRGLHHGGKAL